jgi:NADH-quinone oxidoreductase subunit N
MTISMLGLAGIPATAGFIGKFYLIDATVAGGYTWLGVAIVIGSMISLGYYLPVIAAMWMRPAPQDSTSPLSPSPLPALAGGSAELSPEGPAGVNGHAGTEERVAPQPEVALVAILAGAGIIVFGIIPQPLFDLVHGAGSALVGLL